MKTLRMTAALLLALPVLAHAQEEVRPNVSLFRPAFFQANQPNTALDMVNLLPGFQLSGGNNGVRGFSGSVGNVLIDGAVPTSKQESVQDILRRIPADAVDRIELIRPGAQGVDMYGHPLLVNVIRNRSSTLRARAELGYAGNHLGLTAPMMALNLTWQGDRDTLDAGFTYGREIQGNHGDGFRNRYDALGAPTRLAGYYFPEHVIYSQGTLNYRRELFGGDVNLSGVVRQEVQHSNLIESIIFPSPLTNLGSERQRQRTIEGQLQYEYPLGEASRARMYFIHRSGQENSRNSSTTPTATDITLGNRGTRETILRLDARTEEGAFTLEGGAEGAINILRSRNLLELGGVATPLPASNVRVEEERAEFFGTARWRITSDLSLEGGARNEISTIRQSGDTNLTRSLSFFKPRGLLSWNFAEDHQFRFLAERVVGQLNFNGFVSSANLINSNVQAGNQNLTPPRTTRLEFTWEHTFWERGSITVKLRREFISGLLDNIPVTINGRTFNTNGNIGNGRRDVLEANLTLPLDNIGLTGLTLTGEAQLRDTRVRDLVTGSLREFSGSQPFGGEIGFTHDLPQWNLRWGAELDSATQGIDYRIDEMTRVHNPSGLEIFAEYKPLPEWTVRIFGQDLTANPHLRDRTVYAGLRNTAPVNFRELRSLNSGALYGMNLQYNFGL